MEWICNECGSANNGGSTQCAICGAPRPRAVRCECPRCRNVQWAYNGTRCDNCGHVFFFAGRQGSAAGSGRPYGSAGRPGGAYTPAAAGAPVVQPALSMDEFAVERQTAPAPADEPPPATKPSLGRRILGVLPIAIVVALVIASAGLYIATKDTRANDGDNNAAAMYTVGSYETETESESAGA